MRQIKSDPKTNTIHIGIERFRTLSNLAIDVSYISKRIVSPPEFNRYLIDNFGEEAKKRLIAEIQKASEKSEEQAAPSAD